MLESAIAAGVTAARRGRAAGRRAADAGRAAAGAPARPADGGGDLRVAQPLRGQRDQAVRRRRLQARRRRPSTRSRPRSASRLPAPERIGRVQPLHGALEDYLRELHTRFADLDLSGRRILLDCANGATFQAAPEIFRRLGAEVEVMADEPDGRNINDGCGSTHLEGAHRAGAARAATSSRSRSTATATACWRSTATAWSSTATSSWRWPRCTCTPATGFPAAGWPSR